MPDQQVSTKITTRGVLSLWGVALLLVVGILLIDGVLVMLALVLGLAVLGARWWARRNLLGISVDRDLPTTAWAGSTAAVPFRLANSRRTLDAFDFDLSGDGRGQYSSVHRFLQMPRLSAESAVEVAGRLRVPPRGRHRGGDWQLLSSFPAGLFAAQKRGTFDDEWMVYPAPVLPRELVKVLERAKLEQLMKWRLQNEGGDEFRGIRDYQSGDAIKAIHWAASARAGRMMARQWDPPEPMEGRVGIVLHSVRTAKRMIRPAAFEAALKAACGLVRYFRHEGTRVSFSAACDEWKFRDAPDRGRFSEIFEVLACARRRVETTPEALQATVQKLAQRCERVFVIGDGGLQEWSALVDAEESAVEVICISGEAVKVRPPKLRMRSLATRKGGSLVKGAAK